MKVKSLRIGKLNNLYNIDPSRGFIFIYGAENTGTTTLALSIVEKVKNEGKKVYVLLTEPPFNVLGIISKHYPQYMEDFVFYTVNDEVVPIASYEDYVQFMSYVSKNDDVGAIVIDALDSLVGVVFEKYSKENSFKMDAWGKTYQDIITRVFIYANNQGIIVIPITKEKEDVEVKREGGELKVIKKGVIIPTVNNMKIQRWATTRLRLYEKGKYEVVKSKGLVREGSKFEFTEDGRGTLLPQLLERMKRGVDE